MSKYDYDQSRELDKGNWSFYALIMAAMRGADDQNARLLRGVFPDTWNELQARYNAPGGLLEEEGNRRPAPPRMPASASANEELAKALERGGGKKHKNVVHLVEGSGGRYIIAWKIEDDLWETNVSPRDLKPGYTIQAVALHVLVSTGAATFASCQAASKRVRQILAERAEDGNG